MMRSLFAGVSGLKNHQTRMDVIGNNIANVNTVGFKASRVTFQDMLSQTIQGASSATATKGGTNPMQIGMGMSLASIDTIFTDGSPQPTGKQTDLSISGQGFFVLSDGQNQVYTRAGAFDFDTEGNFIVPGSGYKVMGWKADANGVIDSKQDPAGIQVPVGKSMAAQVSSKITYTNNLSAGAKAIGTPAEQANADAAKVAADAAKVIADNNKVAADAAKTAADTAKTTADAAKAAIDAAKLAMTAAKNAADALVAGTGTQAAVVAAVAAAVSAAQAAVTASSPATLGLATTAKNDADALKTETDGLVAATATPADVVAAAVTAEGSITSAASVAASEASTAAINATTAATAATAAAANAATAATTATKAAQDVLDAYGISSSVPTSITVYDVQGNPYSVKGTFMKTGDNTWSFTPNGTVEDSGVIVANITTTPSTIRFKADGSYDQTSTINTMTINPAGGPYAGAGAFTVTPDFSALTQYGGESSAKATGKDGYASGTLKTVTIDPSGVIIGTFTNGENQTLAQVALAVFNNPGGLNKAGDSLFSQSNNSGEPQIGSSETGGRGKFTPGSLEMSNVDLAQEFSEMIVTQRGFQANSKIITTSDEMLQELANLKR
ncbi:flagellar hook protein FlgE [Sporomusa sp.]|uniref:flagellar hook protein FlgE n=1 Tax=Sporomusa sp. TaxID=2078658 RepID=UPI002C0AFEF8|nr:flagellar hook protein FlgE [Sporomusa sp.]HWR05340.1 flagellar hook protein FlgE [Sporomusa sp.]